MRFVLNVDFGVKKEFALNVYTFRFKLIKTYRDTSEVSFHDPSIS